MLGLQDGQVQSIVQWFVYPSLPIYTAPWINIFMDFVLGLSKTHSERDFIFVMVDRCSKMAHFILCHKTDDACDVVNFFFFREVVRLHGLPKSIVFDRDSKFLSHFWKILWGKLGIKLLFSTTCHPQTDGQTEVVNWTLKELQTWEAWLPHMEFIYNRVINETTSYTPFELVYRCNPMSPLDLVPSSVLSKENSKGLSKAQSITYAKRENKDREKRVFMDGDLVWVHLQKDRFPNLRKSKLLP
ncbi:hypothetical protein CR513_39896, partial [Mucuna pruriens]